MLSEIIGGHKLGPDIGCKFASANCESSNLNQNESSKRLIEGEESYNLSKGVGNVFKNANRRKVRDGTSRAGSFGWRKGKAAHQLEEPSDSDGSARSLEKSHSLVIESAITSQPTSAQSVTNYHQVKTATERIHRGLKASRIESCKTSLAVSNLEARELVRLESEAQCKLLSLSSSDNASNHSEPASDSVGIVTETLGNDDTDDPRGPWPANNKSTKCTQISPQICHSPISSEHRYATTRTNARWAPTCAPAAPPNHLNSASSRALQLRANEPASCISVGAQIVATSSACRRRRRHHHGHRCCWFYRLSANGKLNLVGRRHCGAQLRRKSSRHRYKIIRKRDGAAKLAVSRLAELGPANLLQLVSVSARHDDFQLTEQLITYLASPSRGFREFRARAASLPVRLRYTQRTGCLTFRPSRKPLAAAAEEASEAEEAEQLEAINIYIILVALVTGPTFNLPPRTGAALRWPAPQRQVSRLKAAPSATRCRLMVNMIPEAGKLGQPTWPHQNPVSRARPSWLWFGKNKWDSAAQFPVADEPLFSWNTLSTGSVAGCYAKPLSAATATTTTRKQQRENKAPNCGFPSMMMMMIDAPSDVIDFGSAALVWRPVVAGSGQPLGSASRKLANGVLHKGFTNSRNQRPDGGPKWAHLSAPAAAVVARRTINQSRPPGPGERGDARKAPASQGQPTSSSNNNNNNRKPEFKLQPPGAGRRPTWLGGGPLLLVLLLCCCQSCAHLADPIAEPTGGRLFKWALIVGERPLRAAAAATAAKWPVYHQAELDEPVRLGANGWTETERSAASKKISKRWLEAAAAGSRNSSANLSAPEVQADKVQPIMEPPAGASTRLARPTNEPQLEQAEQAGYRWPFIGLVGFMFLGATGNILVCMAIWRERRLQTATNYFLLSLAVADLLVCILVMPFGIVYEFYGRWPFDWRICNLWVTCDVLTCSSSILHMCFISVGRYLGIRNPLHARQANLFVSRRAVLWRIGGAWVFAGFIASPVTIMTLYDHRNIVPTPNECAISNKWFLMLGSMFAFFLPMFAMVPSYIMTVRLLSRRAKYVRNNSLLLTNQQSAGTLTTSSSSSKQQPVVTCKRQAHRDEVEAELNLDLNHSVDLAADRADLEAAGRPLGKQQSSSSAKSSASAQSNKANVINSPADINHRDKTAARLADTDEGGLPKERCPTNGDNDRAAEQAQVHHGQVSRADAAAHNGRKATLAANTMQRRFHLTSCSNSPASKGNEEDDGQPNGRLSSGSRQRQAAEQCHCRYCCCCCFWEAPDRRARLRLAGLKSESTCTHEGFLMGESIQTESNTAPSLVGTRKRAHSYRLADAENQAASPGGVDESGNKTISYLHNNNNNNNNNNNDSDYDCKGDTGSARERSAFKPSTGGGCCGRLEAAARLDLATENPMKSALVSEESVDGALLAGAASAKRLSLVQMAEPNSGNDDDGRLTNRLSPNNERIEPSSQVASCGDPPASANHLAGNLIGESDGLERHSAGQSAEAAQPPSGANLQLKREKLNPCYLARANRKSTAACQRCAATRDDRISVTGADNDSSESKCVPQDSIGSGTGTGSRRIKAGVQAESGCGERPATCKPIMQLSPGSQAFDGWRREPENGHEEEAAVGKGSLGSSLSQEAASDSSSAARYSLGHRRLQRLSGSMATQSPLDLAERIQLTVGSARSSKLGEPAEGWLCSIRMSNDKQAELGQASFVSTLATMGRRTTGSGGILAHNAHNKSATIKPNANCAHLIIDAAPNQTNNAADLELVNANKRTAPSLQQSQPGDDGEPRLAPMAERSLGAQQGSIRDHLAGQQMGRSLDGKRRTRSQGAVDGPQIGCCRRHHRRQHHLPEQANNRWPRRSISDRGRSNELEGHQEPSEQAGNQLSCTFCSDIRHHRHHHHHHRHHHHHNHHHHHHHHHQHHHNHHKRSQRHTCSTTATNKPPKCSRHKPFQVKRHRFDEAEVTLSAREASSSSLAVNSGLRPAQTSVSVTLSEPRCYPCGSPGGSACNSPAHQPVLLLQSHDNLLSRQSELKDNGAPADGQRSLVQKLEPKSGETSRETPTEVGGASKQLEGDHLKAIRRESSCNSSSAGNNLALTSTEMPPQSMDSKLLLANSAASRRQQPETNHIQTNNVNLLADTQMIRYLGSSMQVRSEQKATKVLGLVFFTFVFCWTPFFVINFAQAFMDRDQLARLISNEMMTTFLWLGYISSTINPVIYTVFNRNFRCAFRQILLCRPPAQLQQRYSLRLRAGESTNKSFRLSQYGNKQLFSNQQHQQPGNGMGASIYGQVSRPNWSSASRRRPTKSQRVEQAQSATNTDASAGSVRNSLITASNQGAREALLAGEEPLVGRGTFVSADNRSLETEKQVAAGDEQTAPMLADEESGSTAPGERRQPERKVSPSRKRLIRLSSGKSAHITHQVAGALRVALRNSAGGLLANLSGRGTMSSIDDVATQAGAQRQQVKPVTNESGHTVGGSIMRTQQQQFLSRDETQLSHESANRCAVLSHNPSIKLKLSFMDQTDG